MMTIVAQDCALEDKMLTVCYGCDMVNVSFANFAAIGRNVAKVTMICILCLFTRESEGICFYRRWFVCMSVCMSVCLSVTTTTKKIVDGFVPNFMGRFLGGEGRLKFMFHYDW